MNQKERITTFSDFAQTLHADPTSKSDIKYLPTDVIEMIWKQYALQNFTHVELIEYGLNDFFYDKMRSQVKDMSSSLSEVIVACSRFGNLEVLKWIMKEQTEKQNASARLRCQNLLFVSL
jgi:hypothetical protein